MSVVNGLGTTFNLPNYVGELFLISPTTTAFLSSIGGINGGKASDTIDFTTQSESLPNASQPANLEGEAAPASTLIAREPGESNCVQIFHETAQVSYTKLADVGQVTPIVAGTSTDDILGTNPVQAEMAHQISLKLAKMALDVDYTFLNGVYAHSADPAVARKSRGILNASGLNIIDAAGSQLDSDLFNALLRMMYDSNAPMISPMIFTGAYIKQRISDAWGYVPQDRNIGGLNIKQIETDFGTFCITLERQIPAGYMLVADVAKCYPVFLKIEGKGFLFEEPLAKNGASESEQIYGEIGLGYGRGSFHGLIKNLATAPDAE